MSQSGSEEELSSGTDAGVSVPTEPNGRAARSAGEEWWNQISSLWTERAQDLVSALVAVAIVVLAAALLVAAVADFFPQAHHHGLTIAATDFLDRALLVLILVEIEHTVILSLRAHELAAQPFLVVGLVAVIRKILFALGSQQKLSTSTLSLYIAMVAVFVAALVVVEVVGQHRVRTSPGRRSTGPY